MLAGSQRPLDERPVSPALGEYRDRVDIGLEQCAASIASESWCRSVTVTRSTSGWIEKSSANVPEN